MRSTMALLTLACLVPGLPTYAQQEGPVVDQKIVRVISTTVTEVVRLRYADAPTTARRLHVQKAAKPNGPASPTRVSHSSRDPNQTV